MQDPLREIFDLVYEARAPGHPMTAELFILRPRHGLVFSTGSTVRFVQLQFLFQRGNC